MMRIVLLFLVAVSLFGVSAGISWFLQPKEPPHAEKAEAEKNRPGEKVRPESKVPDHLSRPPLRPGANPTPEAVMEMAANLHQQQESLRKKEQQMIAREKYLNTIHKDLRDQREGLDKVRLQIQEEMKALEGLRNDVDRRFGLLKEEGRNLDTKAEEVKKSLFEVQAVEKDRIKQMALIYDAMDPEVAGAVLVQMADGGKMDMATKILAAMKQRQAAKVLTQIPDRTVVVQILEKLKNLKQEKN